MLYRRLKYLLMLIGVSVFFSLSAVAQSIIYVNQAANGADNGTSWTDAYTFLQDALAAAQSGDEVWIAAGTYRPDQGAGITPGDREASFEVPSGASLYGGFAGSELTRIQRDWEVYGTILTGDLLGNDAEPISEAEPTRSDNSKRVALIPSNQVPVILDGIVIEGGHGTTQMGGGLWIRGAASLRYLRIRNNLAREGAGVSAQTFGDGHVRIEDSYIENNVATFRAGGIDLWSKSSELRNLSFRQNVGGEGGGGLKIHEDARVSNLLFIDNHAHEGGALYIKDDATVFLSNSTFRANRASVGGAINFQDVSDAETTIVNCLFVANKAYDTGWGGAIFSYDAGLNIINSTFVGNSASNRGGGLAFDTYRNRVTISNSILWGNTAGISGNQLDNYQGPNPETAYPAVVNSSLVEGGLPDNIIGEGLILDSDPGFVDLDGADDILGTVDDDLHLAFDSPLIDAGNATLLPQDLLDFDRDGDTDEALPVDFDFNVRVYDGGLEPGNAQVDIGAYEFGAPPVVLAQEYVAAAVPESISPVGNYPNPFNFSTTISYSLPLPADVQLEVFDLLGKRVRMLESGFKPSGQHEVTFNASGLPTGVYFYTLTAGDFKQTRKMVVVR